ncbi:MAG TPA: glycosyltransferase family 39 protein [Herpetosiphonaceae bacterium]
MRRRIVIALGFFSLALATLVIRYLPAHYAHYELGDPSEGVFASGFFAAEFDGSAIVRWSHSEPQIQIPLADRRGAQLLTLAMRTEEADPQPLVVEIDRVTLATTTTSTLRSYHMLAPATTGRWLNLKLHVAELAIMSQTARGVAVDRLSVIGRSGWPPLADVAALLALALIPALLMVLTMQLAFDWSVVPGALLLSSYLLLPAGDLPGLLLIGPLVALLIAGIVLLPWARRHPVLVLLTLVGGALRVYALGWGGGYFYHPEEQALAQRAADEPLQRLSLWTASWAAQLSDNPVWAEPWSLVLLGRVWSALLGTALIVVVYLLGRRLLRPRWALLAAAYVALVPVLIQQSHFATPIALNVLLVALLMLSSVEVVVTGRLRHSIACGLWSAAVLVFCPQSIVLLSAPVIAHLMIRQRRTPAWATAATAALLCLAALHWSFGTIQPPLVASTALAQNDGTASVAVRESSVIDLTTHALFNILLWSLGPLLMQVSIVGWCFGVLQSLQDRRYRLWLPLLWSLGAYFVVAVLSQEQAHSLTLLVPLLCLTAAFLLQSFAARLDHPLGQRTVRLLAGTGLCLVLMTSIGLLNVYRAPDPRIAASRWLLANVAAEKQIVRDTSVPELVPMGADHLYASAALPDSTIDVEQRRDQYAAALLQADYVVLAVDRDDFALGQQMQRDPVAACYYQALFDGRLGFVSRASFDAQPGIASWTMDDSWVDPALRAYDHPRVRVFERLAAPTPQALDLMLNCDGK